MPGPMSAPNGNANTTSPRDPNRPIKSGKTALKRGDIKPRNRKMSRAQRESQEED